MPRSPDSLGALLRSAMQQQGKLLPPQVRKSQVPPPRPPDPIFDLYSSPLNWTPGRLISLVHRSPEGRETFLGVFTELINERAKVRRLLRNHSPTSHGTLPREVVSGPYWLSPQMPFTPAEDSLGEAQAIRERFMELMKDFS